MKTENGGFWYWIGDAICAVVFLIVLHPFCTAVDFGNDAYSYLDLSHHLFDDFYRIHVIRQFEHNTLYSCFCPPLYPLLVALFNGVWDVGIYAGMFVNAAAGVLTLFSLTALTRPLRLPRFVGNLWFLVLIANEDYLREVAGARTMPVAILLLVVLANVFFRGDLTRFRKSLQLGITAALLVYCRFDMLPAAAALGVAVWWMVGLRNVLPVIVYYAVLAVALSPWMYFSEVRFGKPFASDNSRVATIIEFSHVANFYPADEPPKTIKDDPARWLYMLVTRKTRVVVTAVLGVMLSSVPLTLLAGMTLGLGLSGRLPRIGGASDERQSVPRRVIWFWLILAAQISTFTLPGYAEARYFVPVVLFAAVELTRRLSPALSWDNKSPRYGTMVVLFAGLFTLLYEAQQQPHFARELVTRFRFHDEFTDPHQFDELLTVLGPRGEETPRLLILSGPVNAYRFSALTDYVSVYRPWNLRPETLPALVREFGVTHILDPDHTLLGEGNDPLAVRPAEYPGLWEVPSS